MIDPDLILRAALAQHQGGAPAAACDLYRRVLAVRPTDHDALHLLGVARADLGETAEGVALIQQAIAINPNFPSAHYNFGGLLLALGQAEDALRAFLACIALSPSHVGALAAAGRTLHGLGRLDEAVDITKQALALAPADPALWSDLGTTLYTSLRLDEALRAYDRALCLRPSHAETHYNRGCVLLLQQTYEPAEAAFRAVLAIQPDHLAALMSLGLTLGAQAQAEAALAVFERVLALEPGNLIAAVQRGVWLNALTRHADAVAALTAVLNAWPDHPEALAARGAALWMLQDWDRAEADLDQALSLNPDDVPALIDRGNVFQDRQRYEDALNFYEKALALQPDNLNALMNRGATLQSLQHHAEAIACYQRLLAISPGYDEARLNLGLCQLRAGAWRAGWQGFEARWRLPQWSRGPLAFSGPPWNGQSDLNGKRVLVASEQGHGDVIQFSRFACRIAERGARVILGVERPLCRLMQGLTGVFEIAVPDGPSPDYDLYVPLMSLPALLDLDIEAVATKAPYLHADPAAASIWRMRLAGSPGLKVGLAWAGDPRRHDRSAWLMDGRRSIALERLKPLLAVCDVTFVSLQKDEASVQAAGLPIIDWTAELEDFADTAALIEALDLVISVDTAVAHVAGALARPVWVLNRFDRCWRWMWDRTDTPWYPTMRHFTQTVPGDWETVVAEVRTALTAVAAL